MQVRLGKLLRDDSVRRFLIVGVASFVVDYGLAVALHVGVGVQLNVATTTGLLTGLVVNFLMNKFWTFQAPHDAKRSVRQAVMYGLLVIFNLIFTNIFVSSLDAVHIGVQASKPVATGLIMVFNYVAYRKVVFRNDAPITPPAD